MSGRGCPVNAKYEFADSVGFTRLSDAKERLRGMTDGSEG